MPSPIAHLGVGYAIYRTNKHNLPEDQLRIWVLPLQLVLVAGLSMLPDMDIFLAVVLGDMQTYHNNFSHSFFFAFPVAMIIAALFYWMYRSHFWKWFLICLLSYGFHIIMDFFTAERGVMLFWPFTRARFASPVKLFYGLQWGLGWFSIWHLWTIFTETIFSLVIISTVIFFEKRSYRKTKTFT